MLPQLLYLLPKIFSFDFKVPSSAAFRLLTFHSMNPISSTQPKPYPVLLHANQCGEGRFRYLQLFNSAMVDADRRIIFLFLSLQAFSWSFAVLTSFLVCANIDIWRFTRFSSSRQYASAAFLADIPFRRNMRAWHLARHLTIAIGDARFGAVAA